MKPRIPLLLFLTLWGVFSVSGVVRPDTDIEKYTSLASEEFLDCVGKVYIKGKFIGSCVLIDSNRVLTAAHVVDKNSSSVDIIVKFKDKASSVSRVAIHSMYSSTGMGMYDIALLQLKSKINSVELPELNSSTDEVGKKAIGAGYGAFIIADKKHKTRNSRKIAGNNIIDSVGGVEVNGIASKLFCDFDAPDTKTCNRLGSASPCDLEYLTAGGDSGGGLFIQRKGKLLLVGITRGGGINYNTFLKCGYYGQVMEHTRVAAFISWIEAACK